MKCLTDAVRAEIHEQFNTWMPRLIEAVVAAVLEAGAKATSEVVDDITDAIPGEADDKLIDPLVARIMKVFGFGQ